MEFGVVVLSIVPVRSQPSDRAEMTTQLLFGELVVIHQKTGSWLQIRNVYDNYEGWVDVKQVEKISEDEFRELKNKDQFFVKEVVDVIEIKNSGGLLPVVLGSVIPPSDEDSFTLAGKTFSYSGNTAVPQLNNPYPHLLETAMMFMNAPYLWGGKTPFGVDCSGLMQVVYMLAGIHLLRDASQQATLGETVSLIAEAKPGDLAFFYNEQGEIVHVGMIMENNEIIHASGRVRIDSIDHQGIYNKELKKYTHTLRLIKRIA